MAGQRRRRRLQDVEDGGAGLYFASPPSTYEFIHSGAASLDCVIGGGWPLSRVSNIVGDKSTGKTLLAIEAMANFSRTFPKGKIRYAETEAAFDDGYAEALGLPIKRVERSGTGEVETVEQFYEDINDFIKKCKTGGLYVLDSLDALSDAAEMDKAIDKGSYGAEKAKKMSQTFRRSIQKLEQSKVHLMVISQIRDKMNVSFGRQYTRGGGKALDFYASQVIYLQHIGEIPRTVGGVKRTVGVKIKVKCTKNKIGLPFRLCTFPILFGYGIQDTCASIDWLIENKQTKRTGLSVDALKKIRKKAEHGKLEDEDEVRFELADHVKEGWAELETTFLPTKRKYA